METQRTQAVEAPGAVVAPNSASPVDDTLGTLASSVGNAGFAAVATSRSGRAAQPLAAGGAPADDAPLVEAMERAAVSRRPATRGSASTRSAGDLEIAREMRAVVARKGEQAAPDKAKLTAIEQRVSAVAHRADARCDRILDASDNSVGTLKQAKQHLKASTANYKTAYTTFRGVLKDADAQWEVDKAFEDSVQGLLVAGALAIVGPEVLVVEGAKIAAVRMMASSNAVVARIGYGAVFAMSEAVIRTDPKVGTKLAQTAAKVAEGMGGEGFEQVGGAGVDKAKDVGGVGVGPKPSDTAGGAGASAGDKFEEAFGKLDGLIDLLPQFGGPAKSQKALAMAAQELAKEALKLAGGGQARWTDAELEEKAKALEDEDGKAGFSAEDAVKMQGGLLAAANAIMGIKILSAEEIERKLWLRWMANADPRVLDNKVIEKYLGRDGKKMLDVSWFNFPWERRAAVNKAQDQWAKETTGAAPTATAPGTTPAAPPPPGAPPGAAPPPETPPR